MFSEEKKMHIRLLITLIFFPVLLKSQSVYVYHLNNDMNLEIENHLSGNNIHTSIKPYLSNSFSKSDSTSDQSFLNHPEHLLIPGHDDISRNIEHKKGLYRFVWDNLNYNMIHLNEDIIRLNVYPVMNLQQGYDTESGSLTFNFDRGFCAEGYLGNKVFIRSTYTENEGKFPNYLWTFVRDSNVVPGVSTVKRLKTKHGFDYSFASAIISYSPSKYFNIQFGHDKNFIGDGYRSLLLSDNAAPYPFLKMTTSIGRFQYVNLWAEFTSMQGGHPLGVGFQRKYGAFHYLSTLIGKHCELGVFEAVIWPNQVDSVYRGFELNYLNPIILYHSIQYGLGSPDNSLLGLNGRLNLRHSIRIYSQLPIDDFDYGRSTNKKGFYRNKYAVQLGVKYFNVLGVPHLYFQTEVNQVWPYTYAHKLPIENYTSFNQSLAHPLGANFNESVSFLSYRYKRFFAQYEFQYAVIGIDTGVTGNFGHNIFLSDYSIPNFPNSYGNFVGQGNSTTIINHQLRLDYIINPTNNWCVELTLQHRTRNNSLVNQLTNFISIGLKTNLFNQYTDI